MEGPLAGLSQFILHDIRWFSPIDGIDLVAKIQRRSRKIKQLLRFTATKQYSRLELSLSLTCDVKKGDFRRSARRKRNRIF
jgi:hypothetical protein